MKFIIEKGIFFGLLFNIIVLVILGWVSWKRIHNKQELLAATIRNNEVQIHLERVYSAQRGLENKAKGFVLTSNLTFDTRFEKRIFELEKELEHLNILLVAPEEIKLLKDLEATITAKIKRNKLYVEYAKYKNPEEAKKLILQDEKFNVVDRAAEIISVMRARANLNFENEKLQRDRVEARLKYASWAILIFAIFLLVVVFFIIRFNLKERKKAVRLMEGNTQMFQSIIDNTSNPIFIKQINGEYTFVNKQFENLFEEKNSNIIGKTDNEVFPGEIANSLRATDLEVVKSGKEMEFEEVFPHNGELHTYLVIKFPIRDKDQKIYAIGGIATNISARKKSDIELKESETQSQTIFDSAPDAVVVINEDSQIVKWNRKAEELFNWSAAEAIGKSMPELIMPEKYREAHLRGVKHFVETGEGPILNKTIEITAVRKNKDEFDIELTISASKIKGKYIFIAFLREITQRKQLEQETQQTKNFLDSIIENIPDMIFVKDSNELRFVRLNKAGEKLLGYSRNELIGKNDYDFFPKEQADFFTGKDKVVLTKGQLVDIAEELVTTRTGKRWLHTKKIPIKDESGKPLFLLGISEDITERKRLENERNEAERQLRDNEQRMALILDNIGEGVVVTDNRQRILLFNQMAEEILEIKDFSTLADWSDQYDIFYPDGKTIFPAQNLPLDRALRGEMTDDMDIILLNPNTGERKRLTVNGRPIKDENANIIAAVSTMKDVTKYKEMEKRLVESETKYRNLIGFGRKNPQDELQDPEIKG
jgi:PAS domain S-box-containing protein